MSWKIYMIKYIVSMYGITKNNTKNNLKDKLSLKGLPDLK